MNFRLQEVFFYSQKTTADTIVSEIYHNYGKLLNAFDHFFGSLQNKLFTFLHCNDILYKDQKIKDDNHVTIK